MAHTPGPWAIMHCDKMLGSEKSIYASPETGAHLPNRRNICRVWAPYQDKEWADNASLIAAAPELLEVAEKIIQWSVATSDEAESIMTDAICMAEAAINKAKGL